MNSDPLETIEVEMALLVRKISALTAISEKGSLDRSAYLLLHQISIQNGVGVKTLAHELLLNVSTVSRQAAALEKKGLVIKVDDPNDGRAYFFELTEQGETELRNFKEIRLERIASLLSEWPDEDCETFGRLLKKLNHEIRSYE
nr:MarR family transcriptional regulator [Bacillus massiliigorillae]